MVSAYRLPGTVRPRRYDIHLHARVGEEGFHGQVRIDLDVKQPTRTIELHARDLSLTKVQLDAGGRDARGRASVHADDEMVSLAFDEEIPAGEAALQLAFSGKVSRSMEGLYLSQDGPDRCLATQCEETDARAIFPCFDEPEYKARFGWTVTTTPDVSVLANGPLISSRPSEDGSEVTWRFAETEPMSSYLVALVIGKIASTPEKTVAGVPMRVWAVQGKEHLGEFGNAFAAGLLPWYNDYFGVAYHFKKYDQVAVPSFSAGAMENSGLVIFRKELLLHDPKSTSWRQEKLIARVVAHEFAHMWFGNLVTMQWWDDIWLNESFAEWIAHKAVDALRPDYRIWEDFQQGTFDALAKDALESTHPIYAPVETPEQATEMFDAITYDKGSAVMRMLENFLGEVDFRAGLRSYMREFMERNAEGADLWRHLEQASSRPVTRIMENWITQPGHPIVRVKLAQEGPDKIVLDVAQERYFSSPRHKTTNQTWEVPLVLRYRDNDGVQDHRVLLSERTWKVEFPINGTLHWCHLNADGIGFYRQDLDTTLRARLVNNLEDLSAPEQTLFLGDQWGLVRSGERRIGEFLPVLDAVLRRPANHSVLEAATGRLRGVEHLLWETGEKEAHQRFQAWAREALRPQMEAVGWEPRAGEDEEARQRRATLLSALAVVAEDEEAIRRATRLADQEAQAPESVDPNLAGPAVSIAARFGDTQRFDRHVSLYRQRRDGDASPQETQRYLYTLASFRPPELLSRVFGMMAEHQLPLEALGPMLRSMLHQRHSREPAWEFMKEHWGDLRARLGDMWTGFLVEATGGLPISRRDDLVAFFDANLGEVAQQSRKRALEAMDQHAELRKRVGDDLVAWARGL